MNFVEYKENEKHANSNPEHSDDIDAFKDAGLMLSDTDIVIDIDHLPKKTIEKIIEEFKIHTFTVWTDRGAHLYFRKPHESFRRVSKGVCYLGFEIEQHNKTSRPNGMTIKRNGVIRKYENEDIRQILPIIFIIPTGKKKLTDLTGMDEGDGRNDALFKHRCKIWQAIPKYAQIINFINNYIFAKPLLTKEMEGILRDDIQESGDPDSNYFIATEIMKQSKIVKSLNEIWWIKGSKYVTGIDELRRKVYNKCPGEDTRRIDEIIKQISYRAEVEDDTHGFPIKVKNGYIDDGEFTPTELCSQFTPYVIDIEYKPDAEPVEIVDEYINQITNNDEDYRKLLLEAMGYVMITDPDKVQKFSKFFILRGDGANGKGTFLRVLRKIFGKDNCTSLSIKQLTDDRFLPSMVGKLANLGDDVEPSAIDNKQMKMLKNITSADEISIRRLYQESFNAHIIAKLFFTSNNDLKSYEKGYAFERRVVWLPMFIKIEKSDAGFVSKITTKEALEYWLRLIVEGYQRLMINEDWTHSEIVENFNTHYHEENNPTKTFAMSLKDEDIIGRNISEIELMFNEYTGDSSQKFSSKVFKETVKVVRNLVIKAKWVDGATKKVFCFDEENGQK